MYWYLRRTFFLKDRTKTSEKKMRKRKKNVRICSPSLALKKKVRGALERYCCWSFQVPIRVPAPCDPSLWPLSTLCRTPDPQSCQSSAGAMRGVTESNTWQVVTSLTPRLPVPQRQIKHWYWCIFDTAPSCVVSIPKCGMALRDAAHPLTTKGIASKTLLSPKSPQV